MHLFLRTAVAAGAAAFIGASALPAAAVYATDYVAPKLAHQGKTSVPIAGSGSVIVKVLVKADGTFQVVNVVRSTNTGDNAAALDLAKNSTYHVGLRGGKPTTAFYDFTFKFTGKNVSGGANSGTTGAAAGTAPIARLLRANNYAGAKAAATAYLASHPGDVFATSYLGLADALLGDDPGAAAAFDQVHTIPAQYRAVAAQAYSLASIQVQKSNPTLALTYAQKSLALHADGNGYFALGVAQLASNDPANALTNLKKARDLTTGDPKITTKEKISIDTELMQAYIANNDQANAQTMAAEIKQLDPTSNAAGRIMAQVAYDKATALTKANNYPDAIKAWEAGALADNEPANAVTGWSQAALLMGRLEKPDFKAMSAEADKAIAAKADDPLANYAKGVALVNLSTQNGDAAAKKSGIDYLNKADAEAKAANMIGLSLAIENFIKSIK